MIYFFLAQLAAVSCECYFFLADEIKSHSRENYISQDPVADGTVPIPQALLTLNAREPAAGVSAPVTS